MAKPKYDALADELDSIASGSSQANKIELLFGDSPKLLDAIRRARTERHLGYAAIAKFLTTRTGHKVGDTSVKNWLASQGVD